MGLHRVILYVVTDVPVGYSAFHTSVLNILAVYCSEKVVPAYKNALSQKPDHTICDISVYILVEVK
jgi:hypothetical protein